MNLSKKGTSIVEALVMMVMVTTGIVGLFSIFTESQKLSNSTEQRIQAIQIAREWIEWFENIRDTNWLLFGAALGNCWNVLNYNDLCFNNATTSLDIAHNGSYIINRNTDNRWVLTPITKTSSNDEYLDPNYRTDFLVQKDAEWFYTQSWGTAFNPLFTRELFIEYIEDTDGNSTINSNDEKLRITSIVQWNDSARDSARKIELTTELTNWKNYE